MIVKLVQEKSNFDLQYGFFQGEQGIALAKTPFPRGKMTVDVETRMGERCQLYFNPMDTTGGSSMEERASFKILREGQRVGHIVAATEKTGRFFGGYLYYKVLYGETQYRVYVVALGTKGLYLCMYCGDKLVAMVEKDLKVTNYKDTYMCYLKDEKDFLPLALFSVYYDINSYEDWMEMSVHSTKHQILVGTHKEVMKKYDKNFIASIVALENR